MVQLSQIRGNRAQLDALRRVAMSGRPGHAYLLTGPQGIGKDAVAMALLVRLACLDAGPEQPDACGKCRSCLAADRGEHPDLTRLEPSGTRIKIDQVRDVVRRLRFEPVVGRIKGVLVSPADALGEEAATALLKTLEEPSSSTIFVLVTARPQLLLDTIRSRCQVLRFSELTSEDVAAVLVGEGRSAEQAHVAASLSAGSLETARDLCSEERVALVRHIRSFVVGASSRPPGEVVAFVDGLAPRLAELEATAGRASSDKLSQAHLLWVVDVVRGVLRDLVLLGAGIEAQDFTLRGDDIDGMHRLAHCDVAHVLTALEACERLEERLVFNPNVRLSMIALLVEVVSGLRSAEAS